MHDFLVQNQTVILTTLTAILGAGGVSVVTQFGKRLLALENEKVVQVLFALVAFAAAGLQYLLGQHNLPPTILGLHTAALMGIATPFYFYVIKPLDAFILDLKKFKANQAAAVDGTTVPPSNTPLFDDQNPTSQLIETGQGAPVPTTSAAAATTAPAEFQA